MRALDCWVDINMQRGTDFFRDDSIDQMLESMDRLAIEKSILTTTPDKPLSHVMAHGADRRKEAAT